MPRCARSDCGRWRPSLLVRHAHAGLHLDSRWYCSPHCLEVAAIERVTSAPMPNVGQPRRPSLRLGALLRHLGAIDEAQLTRALERQAATGQRLGALLRAEGAIGDEPLLRALAAQANTSYVLHLDPGTVREEHGGLSRDMVRALGLVPFEADRERRLLRVAYQAPLSRRAMSALCRLTGWVPEPYLVSDEVFPRVLDAYGVGEEPKSVPLSTVQSIAEAAARIVAAAVVSRRVTVREASWDPYLWLRLESPGSQENVLVRRTR